MRRALLKLLCLGGVLLRYAPVLLRLARHALRPRLLCRGLLLVTFGLACQTLLLLAPLDLPLPHARHDHECDQPKHDHHRDYHDDCRHSLTSIALSDGALSFWLSSQVTRLYQRSAPPFLLEPGLDRRTLFLGVTRIGRVVLRNRLRLQLAGARTDSQAALPVRVGVAPAVRDQKGDQAQARERRAEDDRCDHREPEVRTSCRSEGPWSLGIRNTSWTGVTPALQGQSGERYRARTSRLWAPRATGPRSSERVDSAKP